MAARRGLGRGLGALIPTGSDARAASRRGVGAAAAEPEPSEATARDAAEMVREARPPGPEQLPIASIRPNPDQPRRRFDAPELARLADSIRRHGVLQPVVVRQAAEPGRYELVVGERRWRAAQEAGIETLPAVVADVAPRDRLELALVENVQRHDLNPIELAHAFRSLSEAGATQEQIGKRLGFDRSSVANHIRLLDLPRELQADVEEGRLGLGHARTLLSLSNPERRRGLRDRIVQGGLSVRQAEEAARRLGAATRPARKRSAPAPADPDLQQLIDALRERLKTQVRVQGAGGRGRIEIDYFGPEELHRISELILGDG